MDRMICLAFSHGGRDGSAMKPYCLCRRWLNAFVL
jgi:hypothetical protein